MSCTDPYATAAIHDTDLGAVPTLCKGWQRVSRRLAAAALLIAIGSPPSMAQSDAHVGIGQAAVNNSIESVTLGGECAGGQAAEILFFEDFESGAPAWSSGGTGNTWAPSDVRVHAGELAFHAQNVNFVSDQRLISPPVELTAGLESYTLSFWNYQIVESRAAGGCWDGAIVEISTDAGDSWTQLTSSTHPYDGLISEAYSNPLGGLDGWCGDPRPWHRPVFDLTAYEGETVQFRFRLGTDNTVGREGWYIDDVAVQACIALEFYTVTAETGTGEGTITPASQQVEDGSDALFTVTPDTGWSITSVSGDTCNPQPDAGEQWIAVGITEDCAVTADFIQNVHTIGGEVSGLAGSGLVLSLNNDQNLAIGTDGAFSFAEPLVDGSDYSVTVLNQPGGQFCSIDNGSGTLDGSNVDDVLVTCENLALGFSLGSIEFGGQALNQGTAQALVLTNTGTSSVEIEQIEAPLAPFELDLADCAPLPRTLAPGESCTVEVRFTPTSAGMFEDSLQVSSNAMNSPQSIDLSGTGLMQAIPVPATGQWALLLLVLGLLALGTGPALRARSATRAVR